MKHWFFFLALVIICTAASSQELPPPPPAATYGDIDETYSTSGLQVQPKFPGGINAFYQYLIPKISTGKIVEGKMLVTFVVEKDGTVSEPKVVKSVTEKIDKKVVKALLASPKWIPAEQNGKLVRARFTLPLVFKP